MTELFTLVWKTETKTGHFSNSKSSEDYESLLAEEHLNFSNNVKDKSVLRYNTCILNGAFIKKEPLEFVRPVVEEPTVEE